MEPELQAALDRLGAAITGVEARLTSEIHGVESRLGADISRVESSLSSEIHRVETEIRTLMENDVIPKIEQVAEGVAATREQAERRLGEELGAFGPRTVVGEAVVADMLRRLQRLEERTP